MMFLLSVWHPEEIDFDFESDDAQRRMEQVGGFNQALMDAGAWQLAGGLTPSSDAAVFSADGRRSAGRYDSSDAMMGGFWIIEVDSREQAEDWASRAAAACEGPVELRPFQG